MRRPRIAIDAAMLAAAIGIDRAVEGDVGRVVPGDDGAGGVARIGGVEPARLGIGAAPAVVEGGALLRLEAPAGIADRAAAFARCRRRVAHGGRLRRFSEQIKNIIYVSPPHPPIAARWSLPLPRGAPPAFTRLPVFLLVREPRVAEAGADGEDAPMPDVLHVGQFAQPLHHRVVVHDDDGVVAADLGDAVADRLRQVEAAALPVAGQVLAAALDRAVLLDDAWAADADERRQLQLLLAGVSDEALEHADEALHRLISLGLVVAVAPQLELDDAAVGELVLLLAAQLDDAGADVAAADIDGEDRVVAREDPGRRQVDRADEPGLVGMAGDRHEVDVDAVGFEQQGGAPYHELADAAVAKAAADRDALGALPRFEAQKAARHGSELLGEFLDRALHQRRRLGIAGDQDLLQLLLAEFVRRRVAERIAPQALKALAPVGQNLGEGALAGAVADEAFGLAQLRVVSIDFDERQPRGAVRQEAVRHLGLLVGHEHFLRLRADRLTRRRHR